jgi:hypothetical protein
MKKFLFIAIAACGMYAADAQSSKVPTRSAPRHQDSVDSTKPSVVISRTMGNYPEKKLFVRVSIVEGEKGFEVKFSSNTAIEKVEVNRSQPEQILNTITLAPDQVAGSFYMDAPSYQGSNTYRIVFYAPGLPKGIWTTLIQRKKS